MDCGLAARSRCLVFVVEADSGEREESRVGWPVGTNRIADTGSSKVRCDDPDERSELFEEMRLAVGVVRSNRLRSQQDEGWITSVIREQSSGYREETLRRGYIDMDVGTIDTSDDERFVRVVVVVVVDGS